MKDVDFTAPPAVGTRLHTEHGHYYKLTAVEPYVRKRDGAASFVLHWMGVCAKCGLPFALTSGLQTDGLNRRCAACKDPSKPASPSAKAATKKHRALGRAKWREMRKERRNIR